jgi:hypothetical protein
MLQNTYKCSTHSRSSLYRRPNRPDQGLEKTK